MSTLLLCHKLLYIFILKVGLISVNRYSQAYIKFKRPLP